MKRLIPIAVLYCAFAGSLYFARNANAVDLGSGSGSGSAVAATPAPTVHDVTTDPMAYVGDLAAAKKLGWPALVLVIGVGLCEALAYFGKNVSALAWLGRGRWSLVIGGGLAILLAACNAALAGGAYTAIGSAALFAALAYWHQAGTDPAKAA